MAKITRERAVKEKRERKLEKKRAAKAERKGAMQGEIFTPEVAEGDPALDHEPLGLTPEMVAEDPTLEPTESELDPLLDPHQPNGDDGAVLGERVVPGL